MNELPKHIFHFHHVLNILETNYYHNDFFLSITKMVAIAKKEIQ
jgi:hypothetical protein